MTVKASVLGDGEVMGNRGHSGRGTAPERAGLQVLGGKSDLMSAPGYLRGSFSRKIILAPSLRSHLSSPQFPGVKRPAQGQGRAGGGREDSPAAGSTGAEGIPRTRQSAPQRASRGFPSLRCAAAAGAESLQLSAAGWELPSPRPGRALDTRALSLAERTAPAPRGRALASPAAPCRLAQLRHPTPPPTSRAASAEEEEGEEEEEEKAAAVPAGGCAERGRRRSGRLGWPQPCVRAGPASCGAGERRPRARRLASRAQPLPRSATDTHPPSTHRPPPSALRPRGHRRCRVSGSPRERQLPGWRDSLSGSFRAASSAPLDFSFSAPALSRLGGGGGGRGMGTPRGEEGEDRRRLLFF
ncbi:translation initiation factor IF-2-like [Cebus imitator]|uniref:translation initiation factor IF-2-like n=1 Tax=Cebus imitator TaxID=2715852 RepID=UPI00189B3234|nr:translation initiation factor IF-2-like [Cebus imitator]